MFERRMTWVDVLKSIKAEGEQAAKKGQNEWDNPYCFINETDRAYAWEEGFKKALEV